MDTTRVHVPLGLFTLSAYGRPLLDIGVPESAPPHTCLPHHLLPATFFRSLVEWTGVRPTLRLPVRKLYSGTRLL